MAILVLLCVYCCKHKVHNFVEVLNELYVRYFVSDADRKEEEDCFIFFLFFCIHHFPAILHPQRLKRKKWGGTLPFVFRCSLFASCCARGLLDVHSYFSTNIRALNVGRVLLLKVRNRHTVVSVPSLPVESQDAD